MNFEQENEERIRVENLEHFLMYEIRQALSPVFAKSVQELLPGRLPNKPTAELTRRELEDYRFALRIVGDMVQSGEAEVIFDAVEHSEEPHSGKTEDVAVMKFKLHVDNGHHAKESGFTGLGSLAFDEGEQ